MKTAKPNTIDDYIAGVPEGVQGILQQIRGIIRTVAPDAREVIKYQIPTFVLDGDLVHFAAFQKHIGFYPTPFAIEAFRGELADYKWAKGSVQFPLGRPIPFPLIRKIVEFRVKEVREKLVAGNGRKPSRSTCPASKKRAAN